MPQDNPQIDPASYGPPPLNMEVGASLRESLGYLDEPTRWLMEARGQGVKKRFAMDMIGKAADQGETPSDLAEYADAEDAAKNAMAMAEASLKMSDADFENLYGQLTQEVGSAPDMPVKGQPEPIGGTEAAITGVTALLFPKHALKIGAVPFQNAISARDQLYSENVQRYGEQMARRGEK